jgi:4-methylaminobutanoate oxidase (formaldehyde-forming)
MKDEPLHKKLVTVVLDTGDSWVWGGEALLVNGVAVGEISSAGWSDAAGRCVALGYVRGGAATRAHAGGAITVDLWGDAIAASAWDSWNPAISATPRSR